MSPPNLPTEVLYQILDGVGDRQDLYHVSCASRQFREMADSILYAETLVPAFEHIARAFRRICLDQRAPRAGFMHRLLIHICGFTYEDFFHTTVQPILQAAVNLRDFQVLYHDLSGDKPPYDLSRLCDYQFRLKTFHWQTTHVDPDGLVAFLENQPSLEVLLLPLFELPITLSASSLPNLRVLCATLTIASSILLGRAITHLKISRQYHQYSDQEVVDAFSTIRETMVSNVKVLDISIFPTSRVFPRIPSMPNLECVVFHSGGFWFPTTSPLDILPSPVTKLRCIRLESWDVEEPTHLTPTIALLFNSIPSLECVSVGMQRSRAGAYRCHYRNVAQFLSITMKVRTPRGQLKSPQWFEEWYKDWENDFVVLHGDCEADSREEFEGASEDSEGSEG